MSRTLPPLAVLAIVALISVISAGCGSNASSETGTASSAGTRGNKKLSARGKAVKFAECIRAHGVSDFPDPNEKNQFEYGVSVTPAVWTRASTACKALQPPGTLSGKRTPKQQSASRTRIGPSPSASRAAAAASASDAFSNATKKASPSVFTSTPPWRANAPRSA